MEGGGIMREGARRQVEEKAQEGAITVCVETERAKSSIIII